jgi:hypothetical protein
MYCGCSLIPCDTGRRLLGYCWCGTGDLWYDAGGTEFAVAMAGARALDLWPGSRGCACQPLDFTPATSRDSFESGYGLQCCGLTCEWRRKNWCVLWIRSVRSSM